MNIDKALESMALPTPMLKSFTADARKRIIVGAYIDKLRWLKDHTRDPDAIERYERKIREIQTKQLIGVEIDTHITPDE